MRWAAKTGLVMLMTLAVLVACGGSKRGEDTAVGKAIPAPAPGPKPGATGDAEVARLEAQARSMVRATGCGSDGECRSAPVGHRACGGPRDYLVYCRTSTDSVALQRVLAQLESAERSANERSGAMSTCDFRMPPETGLRGGLCVAR